MLRAVWSETAAELKFQYVWGLTTHKELYFFCYINGSITGQDVPYTALIDKTPVVVSSNQKSCT